VIIIPFIADLYQRAQERNILAGIIIIDVIAFVSYIIFPSGVVYFGDVQMIFGCIVGIRFTLKNIKINQSSFTCGIIVGLGGLILTGISFTMFDWVYFFGLEISSPVMLLLIFELYFIEAIIIGIGMGSIIGWYYKRKGNILSKPTSKEDEFLESLIDK